ncbi:MAG: hypothetical protein JEZ09_12520 [Salinivirgaceae bacterium]|nr:hypothetical protein [Salinivirgaceae bacterium]
MTLPSEIDKLFKEGLSDYSQRPPGFVWDNIEQALNKQRFKKQRNVMYALAASLALLLSFGAGYLFTNSETDTTYVAQVTELDNLNKNLLADKSSVTAEEVKQKEAVKNIEIPVAIQNQINENVTLNQIQALDKKETKIEKAVKTEAKKVQAEGILLPPIFADQGNFENANNSSFTDVQVAEERESLELIERQKMDLAMALMKRDLVYEYREVPMYPLSEGTDSKVKDYSTWSVGMSASPLVSYREVNNIQTESLASADITSNYENKYQNEKPLVSYSAGIDVNYNVSKRFKIQSGVYYSEIGQISENVDVNKSRSYINDGDSYYTVNTSMGNVNIKGTQNQIVDQINTVDRPVVNGGIEVPGNYGFEKSAAETADLQTSFVQSFEYYEIPIILNYRLIDKKLGVNMSGGLSANFLSGNNAYVEGDGARYNLDAQSENLNSVGYNGIVGLAFDYPIFSKLYFNFQPLFKYSINSISEENKVHPYSFGIYTGLRYNF